MQEEERMRESKEEERVREGERDIVVSASGVHGTTTRNPNNKQL